MSERRLIFSARKRNAKYSLLIKNKGLFKRLHKKFGNFEEYQVFTEDLRMSNSVSKTKF
jgi:muconolactone delta-isomerase